MRFQSQLNQFANPFVELMLRSPLHGLMSGSIMLVTVTGRKTLPRRPRRASSCKLR
jgi:hypothetical protein